MAKKKKCPEFENHERWLVAWADLLTLLFALFVVLYSISNVEVEKLRKVSNSIAKAFGNPNIPKDDKKEEGGKPQGNSRSEGIFNKTRGNTSRDSLMTRNRRERTAIIASEANTLERKIAERLYGSKDFPDGSKEKDKDRVVFVTRDPDGIRVTLLARKFFKPSQTGIDGEAKLALDAVALSIKGMGRLIRVEGHTDNRAFDMNGMTNWELSASRASAVVRYLIDRHKFNSQSLYAAGFADSQPISTNDTPENRSLNRRVDLKILYDSPAEDTPGGSKVPDDKEGTKKDEPDKEE